MLWLAEEEKGNTTGAKLTSSNRLLWLAEEEKGNTTKS